MEGMRQREDIGKKAALATAFKPAIPSQGGEESESWSASSVGNNTAFRLLEESGETGMGYRHSDLYRVSLVNKQQNRRRTGGHAVGGRLSIRSDREIEASQDHVWA